MSDDLSRKGEELKEGEEIEVGPGDQINEKVEPTRPPEPPPQDDPPSAA